MLPRWLCVIGLFVAGAPVCCGQEEKDPLRFVPSQAEWVLKVDRPRDIVAAIEKNPLFQDAQKLAGIREYYDSTNFRRLYQLIAYFEEKMGQNRDEIVEVLSAGGFVAAARFTPPGGIVFALQSRNEKNLRRFVDLALEVLDQELQRQESKDRLVRSRYADCDVGQVGAKFFFALADGALLVSPEEKALKLAIDTGLKKGAASIREVPAFVEARKTAPRDALAWTWFHIEEIRKIPAFKAGLDAAALDPAQTLLFGGLVDQVKRTPYVSATLTREADRDHLGIYMPRGREGMAALSHILVPKDGKGSLAPLTPPRTLASASYFLDLGQYWDRRIEILGVKNAKGLEDADKNIAKFLGGLKLGKLLNDMGPHHRIIFAQQKTLPYKITPAKPFPSFALVVDMRDPLFAKNMNTILRSGALLATFKYGLNLKEETYNGCEMVSYHFSETKKVPDDPENFRFHFTPSYVTVGEQFVISATAELARDLVDAIKAEGANKPGPSTMRTRLHASGFRELAAANQDTFLTQLILSQALPPSTARQELSAIMDWFDRLGTLQFETNYGARDFHYDIVWQPKKK